MHCSVKTTFAHRTWTYFGLAARVALLPRLLLALVTLLLLAAPAHAGLKIYYIRHAEGGHNVVKEWEKIPKAQWPDYVGNGNVFTPKGKTQVIQATEKLQKYRFDFIAVSPMWRTRNTVLPYLKAIGAKGEIWPELHEFSGGGMILSTNLPKPAEKILGAGTPIDLPADEAPYFTLRKGAKRNFKLPSPKDEKREAAIQVAVRSAAALVRERFGGTDKSILLVGHGNAGKALLKLLTQSELPELSGMANARIWMVEEQPNGRFALKMYNDEPIRKPEPVAAQ